MSINLHLLNIYRPDLTQLVAQMVDRHYPQLVGTIRVDHFVKVGGPIIGTHLFYVIFQEPRSIGCFTVFLCGATSGDFSLPAQAFQTLMTMLQRYRRPIWSLHSHSLPELYNIFGVAHDAYGIAHVNPAAMGGINPGQYDANFLASDGNFAQAVLAVLRSNWNNRFVHEAFLSLIMGNYRALWEIVLDSIA